ncbi:YqjD family protein [Pseudoroseicyclus sp. CXY001]|uniref:DUF883 family protein n=1 Tax=Pseudoroseicyclus sp. CXY001 TaxID=3242492 RepID=UPI00358DC66F
MPARGSSNNGVEATLADFMKQFETLKEDLAELSQQAAEIGATQKKLLRSNAVQGAEVIRSRSEAAVAELSSAARRAAEGAAETATTQVRENPAAAIGLATGIGFLVGLVLSRRK